MGNKIVKKYHILYITSVSSNWGSEKNLLTLIKNLDTKQYNPVVFTTKGEIQSHIQKYNISYSIFESQTLTKKEIIQFAVLVFKIAVFIKKNELCLIHSNDVHSAQYSILAACLAGIPSVVHIQNTDLVSWLKPINKTIFRLADRVIAISERVRDDILAIGIRPDRIELIHNAVDLEEFDNKISGKLLKEEIGINSCNPLIGVVGRIITIKGQKFFIEAIPDVLHYFPEANFVIVGEDTSFEKEYIMELKELIKKNKIGDKIFLAGYRECIPQIMRSLDILVVPSLCEAFGRVIIEAMAMKTPVIASNIGGIPFVIEHRVTGILVPPRNSQAISDAIVELLTDKELFDMISKNGRRMVEEKFSIPLHISKIEQLYKSLINDYN